MVSKYANVPSKGDGKKPKIFVLDTNIVLHDFKAIRKFQDNDIVIPIAVLEELDKFKKVQMLSATMPVVSCVISTGLPREKCSVRQVFR